MLGVVVHAFILELERQKQENQLGLYRESQADYIVKTLSWQESEKK